MTTKVIFNADPKIKARAMANAKKQGVTISYYLNNALAEFASGEKRFGMIEVLNKKTQKEINQAIKDYRLGKNISPAFTDAKDAIAWLKK